MRIGQYICYKWHGNTKNIKGMANQISLGDSLLKNTAIKIHGNHNFIEIGNHARLKNCHISIKGHHHRLHIANHVALYDCELKFEDDNCLISIGARSKILKNGYIAVAESNSSIRIGEDCLISTDFHLRNSDSHSILDKHTGKRLNAAKDIYLGNHIWIGGQVQILKGVTIMNNAIIGMRSLVTKDIAENTLVAGAPARVIKTDVDWCEDRI